MYVAKKSFHSHEFTYKNEILIAMLSKYQGHGYFLTVTKTRQQHSFCVGRRRMTGHNIVIMTDNCSFLFLLEAGAGGNNQY